MVLELSAIFVSNVIIPGKRPENQPDGLSPMTTARTEETNEEREKLKKEGEREEGAKVKDKGRSRREKLIARFMERSGIRRNLVIRTLSGHTAPLYVICAFYR